MKKCSKCGTLNYESSWTCRNCFGTEFEWEKYDSKGNIKKWVASFTHLIYIPIGI